MTMIERIDNLFSSVDSINYKAPDEVEQMAEKIRAIQLELIKDGVFVCDYSYFDSKLILQDSEEIGKSFSIYSTLLKAVEVEGFTEDRAIIIDSSPLVAQLKGLCYNHSPHFCGSRLCS